MAHSEKTIWFRLSLWRKGPMQHFGTNSEPCFMLREDSPVEQDLNPHGHIVARVDLIVASYHYLRFGFVFGRWTARL